jgi:hypothetical protein
VARRAVVCLAVVVLVATAVAAGALPPPSAGELERHVLALTVPEMEGRGSGTPGGERAARYIAERLTAFGLRPGGDGGTFFQSFVVGSSLRVAAGARLERLGPGGTGWQVGRDWQPHGGSLQAEVSGEVVPVGYGIGAPESGHDDYARVDVHGKIALAMDGAPPGTERRSRLEKLIAARRSGARALLIATDALPTLDSTSAPFALVSASISRAAAAALAPGTEVRVRVALERDDRLAANVVAVLPGTDPALAAEVIVLGAHYDHLGLRSGAVFPGADDNASGTAVVLGLARALATAGGLPRTVVVALFSGEELGLLGSGHYVRHPTVPLDRTVAMLNFDMVGRMRESRLNVSGVESGAGLRGAVSEAARDSGLDLALRDSPEAPSDHTRFYAAGVPVLFFHTGSHSDYHEPSDTPDKINTDGLARIAALAGRVVERVAPAPRPTYARLSAPARAGRGGGAPGGAFLGVSPDFRTESDGVRLGTIVSDSGAAKAGLRDGDILVRVADTSVSTFEDLRRELGRRRPGDTVRLVYLRDGQDHATTATLGVRP